MYCPSCGKEVLEGAGFCAHCGTAVLTAVEAPQHTLTFVRYDEEGPTLSVTAINGENIALVGRDRHSISLPKGGHTLALRAGNWQETLEVPLDTDTQVNLYWSSEEKRFLTTLDSSVADAASAFGGSAEDAPAMSVNEAWSAVLAQVDRSRDILAGVLSLGAALALLLLPIVTTRSLLGGSVSMNLMDFCKTLDLYFAYGVSSADGIMLGVLALFLPWWGILCAVISGVAALISPSKISYSMYLTMSGPLSFVLVLIVYYIAGDAMVFTPGMAPWVAIALSTGAWVASWPNFKLVRTELKKVPRK